MDPTGTNRVRIGGGTTRELPPVVAAGAGVIVVVVPTGAPVTLVVTDSGRDQSISLRTGQPGADAVTAYTAQLPAGSAEFSVTGQFAGVSKTSELEVEVSAVVQPYHGTWAAPGRTWLAVTVSLRTWVLGSLGGRIDLKQSLRLRVDGRTVTGKRSDPELARRPDVPAVHEASGRVVLEVPADGVGAVTVRFTR